MKETSHSKPDETAPVPLSLPRRLVRWGTDHPYLILSGVILIIALRMIEVQLRIAPRRPPAARAASDTKTAVTQALVYSSDHGVYPTSVKVLRDAGYVNVADKDTWGRDWVLSPALTQGRAWKAGDDVYVYSKGPCGTGTYEPTRWGRSTGEMDTGKCGAVGYSSIYGSFRFSR